MSNSSRHLPSKLTVPAEAVLDSRRTTRRSSWIAATASSSRVQVKTGERDGDRIEILSGLSAGERIVTSGNFLIDSESQMKAAASGMGGMPGMPGMSGDSKTRLSKRAENPLPKPCPACRDAETGKQ